MCQLPVEILILILLIHTKPISFSEMMCDETNKFAGYHLFKTNPSGNSTGGSDAQYSVMMR